jgi:hypothetical protein
MRIKAGFGGNASMPEKIILMDEQMSWPSDRPLWEITEVSFGYSTDWDLQLLLERNERSEQVIFANPVSFRVHDERELMSYWTARAEQGVQIGTFYCLEESGLVQQFAQGFHGGERLRHFLVAGVDTCVEVIGTRSPVTQLR